MPGSSAGGYVSLLRRPAVARTFALALAGRLAYGVLPLSFLFTVQHATDSFATAATAMALNGLAAFSMPAKARLIDRHGQRLVIPLITTIMAGLLVAASVMGHVAPQHPAPWWGIAVATGLASPPLGPSMRAQWRVLVPDRLITRAYSLDAVGEETLYLVGPMTAAGILAFAPAYAGLLLCALLVLVGAAGLASSPAAVVTSTPERRRSARGPLRHRGLLGLLVIMGAVGSTTAMIYTSTAARALAVDQPSYAGLADAGLAAGAVLGGIAWGRLRPAWPWPRSLARLLAIVGTVVLVASVLGSFWSFAIMLAIAGPALAPIYVVAYRASDTIVDPAEVTEASTWVNTATNLGVSLGGAVAGWLVSVVGPRSPGYTGATLAAAAAVTIIVAARRRPDDAVT